MYNYHCWLLLDVLPPIINTEILFEFQNQVEHSLDSTTSVQTEEEAQSHSPTEDNSSSIPKLEAENPLKARHSSRKYFYTSVFILLLSVSATYFLDKKHLIFNVFNG